MLDPGKRKCSECYENQELNGIPIPDCTDPDGLGKPCPYPRLQHSLEPQNYLAWELWGEISDQMVNLTPMSEPTFTLNLESLRYAMQLRGRENDRLLYRKVRVLFNLCQKLLRKNSQPKTRRAFKNLEGAKQKAGR